MRLIVKGESFIVVCDCTSDAFTLQFDQDIDYIIIYTNNETHLMLIECWIRFVDVVQSCMWVISQFQWLLCNQSDYQSLRFHMENVDGIPTECLIGKFISTITFAMCTVDSILYSGSKVMCFGRKKRNKDKTSELSIIMKIDNIL